MPWKEVTVLADICELSTLRVVRIPQLMHRSGGRKSALQPLSQLLRDQALGCHHDLLRVMVSATLWLLVVKGSHLASNALGSCISVPLLLSSLACIPQPMPSRCPRWRCVLFWPHVPCGFQHAHAQEGVCLCHMQGNSGISIQAHFLAWPLLSTGF